MKENLFMHKTFACMAVVIFQASSSSNASISERRMKEKAKERGKAREVEGEREVDVLGI